LGSRSDPILNSYSRKLDQLNKTEIRSSTTATSTNDGIFLKTFLPGRQCSLLSCYHCHVIVNRNQQSKLRWSGTSFQHFDERRFTGVVKTEHSDGDFPVQNHTQIWPVCKPNQNLTSHGHSMFITGTFCQQWRLAVLHEYSTVGYSQEKDEIHATGTAGIKPGALQASFPVCHAISSIALHV